MDDIRRQMRKKEGRKEGVRSNETRNAIWKEIRVYEVERWKKKGGIGKREVEGRE